MAERDRLAILRERAEKLATLQAAVDDQVTEPLVGFEIGGHGFAVPVRHVVYGGRLRHLTAIPSSPPYLLGVTALSGHLVSIVDLPELLGLRQRGLGDVTAGLVVAHGARKLGLGAEQLLGIFEVPAARIKSYRNAGSITPRIVLPGGDGGGRSSLVIAVDELFADPRLGGGGGG